MKYKFEVIVAVEGVLSAAKEIFDNINETMASFTGTPGRLTARGHFGDITVSSDRALIPTEIELFRAQAEDLLAKKYPEWKAEVKFAGEI